MNWITNTKLRKGKFAQEKKQQQDFFERQKFVTQVKRIQNGTPHRLHGMSKDLVALHNIDRMFGPKLSQGHRSAKQVVKVDLDAATPANRRFESLDLGPITEEKHIPSKLQLMDSSDSVKSSQSNKSSISKKMTATGSRTTSLLDIETFKIPENSQSQLSFPSKWAPETPYESIQKPSSRVSFSSKLKFNDSFERNQAKPEDKTKSKKSKLLWDHETPGITRLHKVEEKSKKKRPWNTDTIMFSPVDINQSFHDTKPAKRKHINPLFQPEEPFGCTKTISCRDPFQERYSFELDEGNFLNRSESFRRANAHFPEDFQATPLCKYDRTHDISRGNKDRNKTLEPVEEYGDSLDEIISYGKNQDIMMSDQNPSDKYPGSYDKKDHNLNEKDNRTWRSRRKGKIIHQLHKANNQEHQMSMDSMNSKCKRGRPLETLMESPLLQSTDIGMKLSRVKTTKDNTRPNSQIRQSIGLGELCDEEPLFQPWFPAPKNKVHVSHSRKESTPVLGSNATSVMYNSPPMSPIVPLSSESILMNSTDRLKEFIKGAKIGKDSEKVSQKKPKQRTFERIRSETEETLKELMSLEENEDLEVDKYIEIEQEIRNEQSINNSYHSDISLRTPKLTPSIPGLSDKSTPTISNNPILLIGIDSGKAKILQMAGWDNKDTSNDQNKDNMELNKESSTLTSDKKPGETYLSSPCVLGNNPVKSIPIDEQITVSNVTDGTNEPPKDLTKPKSPEKSIALDSSPHCQATSSSTTIEQTNQSLTNGLNTQASTSNLLAINSPGPMNQHKQSGLLVVNNPDPYIDMSSHHQNDLLTHHLESDNKSSRSPNKSSSRADNKHIEHQSIHDLGFNYVHEPGAQLADNKEIQEQNAEDGITKNYSIGLSKVNSCTAEKGLTCDLLRPSTVDQPCQTSCSMTSCSKHGDVKVCSVSVQTMTYSPETRFVLFQHETTQTSPVFNFPEKFFRREKSNELQLETTEKEMLQSQPDSFVSHHPSSTHEITEFQMKTEKETLHSSEGSNTDQELCSQNVAITTKAHFPGDKLTNHEKVMGVKKQDSVKGEQSNTDFTTEEFISTECPPNLQLCREESQENISGEHINSNDTNVLPDVDNYSPIQEPSCVLHLTENSQEKISLEENELSGTQSRYSLRSRH